MSELIWIDREGRFYRGNDGTIEITRSRAAELAGGPAKLQRLVDQIKQHSGWMKHALRGDQ